MNARQPTLEIAARMAPTTTEAVRRALRLPGPRKSSQEL